MCKLYSETVVVGSFHDYFSMLHRHKNRNFSNIFVKNAEQCAFNKIVLQLQPCYFEKEL